jgi:ribosomal protein S21
VSRSINCYERFKNGMDKSGILREYKRKRYLKSNGELQHEKAKAAAQRRRRKSRPWSPQRRSATSTRPGSAA